MSQFLMSTLNVLFPPAMRNQLLRILRIFWNRINLAQLHIYFAVEETPFLRWMCPAFMVADRVIRFFCWMICYLFKLGAWFVVNFVKVYLKLLRYAICLFYSYSILRAISGMELATNLPILEMILQNTEWIYQYAGQLIGFNVAIVKKAVENFCSVPFEQKSLLERGLINWVMRLMELLKQSVGN